MYKRQDKGHNLVQAFPVNVGMLDKMLILDIVLDDFLIHAVCAVSYTHLYRPIYGNASKSPRCKRRSVPLLRASEIRPYSSCLLYTSRCV